MNAARFIMLSLLVIAVLVSAIAVVSTKNTSRQLFVALQSLTRDSDELDIVWGKLQLEHGAWGAPGRVQQLAHDKLKMRLPMPVEVVVVRRSYGS